MKKVIKKTKKIIEEEPLTYSEGIQSTPSPKSTSISLLEVSFGNGEINLLRDKINELINHVS